ncbi:MAG: acetylxylan esterase, partial [Victivallales bacterium]|nr:acetylxylan esterase [Victivallales bacterium]
MEEEKKQSFTINCNVKSHVCHVGEFVEFDISAPVPDTEAEVLFTADGEAELGRFIIKTPCTLRQTLPFPGFLRCRVSAPNMETAWAGVGFDPESIRPALPPPDDFQEYWKNALSQLKTISPDFQMEEIAEYSDSENTYYELSCNTVNEGKCYGFLRMPKADSPVPLLIYFEGAGVGMSRDLFTVHCKTCDAHLPGP